MTLRKVKKEKKKDNKPTNYMCMFEQRGKSRMRHNHIMSHLVLFARYYLYDRIHFTAKKNK